MKDYARHILTVFFSLTVALNVSAREVVAVNDTLTMEDEIASKEDESSEEESENASEEASKEAESSMSEESSSEAAENESEEAVSESVGFSSILVMNTVGISWGV